MVSVARMKQIQQQSIAGVKPILFGARHWLWAFLLAIVLFSFIVSQELLYDSHWKRTMHANVELPSSNEMVLMYPENNLEGLDDRERIRYLLEKTKFGKISVRDILYSPEQMAGFAADASGTSVNRIAAGKAWMLPLSSKRFAAYMPTFFQLAKKWLGDDDFDPKLIMQGLLESVKRPLDQNSAYWASGKSRNESSLMPGRNRYESCAVVGNSGILLNGSYGEQIDSHEMVIRLNNAEIVQYKKYVGSKTTLSFMNSNVFRMCSARATCWCHPYGVEVPIITYVCQAQHLLSVAVCSSLHKSALLVTPLLVTPSLLDTLCARIVKWYSLKNFVETTGRRAVHWDAVHDNRYFHYSSGMQAIVLALGICDRVTIFGFGKSAEAKHHYHSNQRKELAVHDYAAEYVFYDDLVNNRTIPFLNQAGISIPAVQVRY